MSAQFSKPISKGDDGAKDLIIESLEGKSTGGFDLDSIYCNNGKYTVIEFLKCETVRPFDSHPKRYWHLNSQKFKSLWEIALKLEADLFLVNYEDSREQFKVIKVKRLDQTGITEEEFVQWNFLQFKTWFQKLNSSVLEQGSK
jgi:hypothetical protein